MGIRYYDPITARFVTRDPALGINDYAYCGNNPVGRVDADGEILETIADIASIGWSTYDLIKNPSWANVGYLAWDVGATVVPFAPGSYVAKGAKIATKGIKAAKGAKVAKAVTKGVKSVSKSEKSTKAAKKTQKIYRVYGGESRKYGQSWTTIDPRTVKNYRSYAGLPDVNTGDFLVEATIKRSTGFSTRSALPLDGNPGGIFEIRFDDAGQFVKDRISVKHVHRIRPPF